MSAPIEAALRDMVSKAFVDPKTVTPGLVIQLTAQLASIVNPIKELTGPQKKELILNVLKDAIALPQFGEIAGTEVQTGLISFLNDVLPGTIDVIVDAARGKYDLQKSVDVATNCCCLALSFLPAALERLPKKH